MNMHVLHIVGARPNFIKAAPVMRALGKRGKARQTLVHTGQHYDANMSDIFFQQLSIPAPDVNLGVGSGSHSGQTADIMTRLDPVIQERQPDLVLVYGDVNSTLAGALVCAKANVPFGHVEAGLRSFDRSMPEEINRLLTDQVADLLFTPSANADDNLRREGVERSKIHLVGNVMIDTLTELLPSAKQLWPLEAFRSTGDAGSSPIAEALAARYGLVTLHRPSNVDDAKSLRLLMTTLARIHEVLPLVMPVHPRTKHRIEELGIGPSSGGPYLTEPLGYLEFLALQFHAAVVITDSGGIQEETTSLGIPCLTIRENTERPITVTVGTNTLVGGDMPKLEAEVDRIVAGGGKVGGTPAFWDGLAAERIADVLRAWSGTR